MKGSRGGVAAAGYIQLREGKGTRSGVRGREAWGCSQQCFLDCHNFHHVYSNFTDKFATRPLDEVFPVLFTFVRCCPLDANPFPHPPNSPTSTQTARWSQFYLWIVKQGKWQLFTNSWWPRNSGETFTPLHRQKPSFFPSSSPCEEGRKGPEGRGNIDRPDEK